ASLLFRNLTLPVPFPYYFGEIWKCHGVTMRAPDAILIVEVECNGLKIHGRDRRLSHVRAPNVTESNWKTGLRLDNSNATEGRPLHLGVTTPVGHQFQNSLIGPPNV